MTEAFADGWIDSCTAALAAGPDAGKEFTRHGFEGAIGLGLDDEPNARAVLSLGPDRPPSLEPYTGQALRLDLRARPRDWTRWQTHGVDPVALGVALASRRLQTFRGDIGDAIDPPTVAVAFAGLLDTLCTAGSTPG